ncbi:MAG TPA: hypothetical protein DDZ96_10100, partial [Porphyromonadaceae bacterium]|nr:hypothetical protein [Porphyromonadaceae bacterium]
MKKIKILFISILACLLGCQEVETDLHMKVINITIVLSIILQMVLSLNSFAQNEKMNSSSRMFEKKIEPSMFPSGTDNLKNKTKMQLLFFPDYNGMIEFLVEPSFCGAYGFRITISNNQYILEAKQI